jgi:uncharacterized protein (TIGR02246 family)
MLSRRDLPVLAALTISAACRPQAVPISSADQQALRAATDSFAQRVRRADYRAAAALYATDAQFMPPNQRAVVGRDNILKWMNAFPPIKSFELVVDEVDGNGDVAYLRGRYMMTFSPPGAKSPVSDTGKYLVVHRRQADGSWPLVADIFNSNKAQAP